MNMKVVFLAAALIFSAATGNVFSQSTTTSPSPNPSPTPGMATSVSSGPDWKLPVAASPAINLVQQQTSYVRPDAETRFKRYVNSTVGPIALVRTVVGAGISTARNSPEEWGGQWEGFGKRVASNFGRNLISETTQYGLDEALKLDSHYYRSKRSDAGSKIRNALLSPVTARNSSGKRVIGIPRIIGTYTGSVVAAETWFPDRFDWKDGVRNGSISLGFNAAFNLFKEFVWKK